MTDDIRSALAPTGVLRAGINMANVLLVTGRTAEGDPDGVAPDMAREIARRLDVGVTFVPFPSPGEVADAAKRGEWDVAMIGADPSRAELIEFTAAYVEIEATYLVPAGSPLKAVSEVDRAGVRIAISERSAYDLVLSRDIQNAELVRAKGMTGATELWVKDGLDALAGLRPPLLEEAEKHPGSRVLDGAFTTVQQAIGTPRGNTATIDYLRAFVEEAKAGGLVTQLLDRHGVTGRLSVAKPG
jgi:polar amino acid transport system substrate-binding protein